jgi:hypothetical protein
MLLFIFLIRDELVVRMKSNTSATGAKTPHHARIIISRAGPVKTVEQAAQMQELASRALILKS